MAVAKSTKNAVRKLVKNEKVKVNKNELRHTAEYLGNEFLFEMYKRKRNGEVEGMPDLNFYHEGDFLYVTAKLRKFEAIVKLLGTPLDLQMSYTPRYLPTRIYTGIWKKKVTFGTNPTWKKERYPFLAIDKS